MAPGLKGKAIVFGAGSVGRGFLGQLLSQSGYETVFVDIDAAIIDSLNRLKRYSIHIASVPARDVQVHNVRAVHASSTSSIQSEVATADLCATAVGQKALPEVARLMAGGIEKRMAAGGSPLNVLVCENIPFPARTVRKLLSDELSESGRDFLAARVGIVGTVVSRMVPVVTKDMRKKDPLYISAEEYAVLPVDKKAFVGNAPEIKGMELCEDIGAYVERKLFTHNASHSICAYLGYLKGYRYIWEAIGDAGICSVVRGAMRESGDALVKKHGFSPEVQMAHEEDIIRRFGNRALGDTVARAARDPLRKLGPNERLAGAARLAIEQGVTPVNISKGIAAAVCYDDPADAEAVRLARLLKEKGLDAVLKEVCSLEGEGVIAGLVKKHLSGSGTSPTTREAVVPGVVPDPGTKTGGQYESSGA